MFKYPSKFVRYFFYEFDYYTLGYFIIHGGGGGGGPGGGGVGMVFKG